MKVGEGRLKTWKRWVDWKEWVEAALFGLFCCKLNKKAHGNGYELYYKYIYRKSEYVYKKSKYIFKSILMSVHLLWTLWPVWPVGFFFFLMSFFIQTYTTIMAFLVSKAAGCKTCQNTFSQIYGENWKIQTCLNCLSHAVTHSFSDAFSSEHYVFKQMFWEGNIS